MKHAPCLTGRTLRGRPAGYYRQRGQSMVEYVVILAALTAALLAAGNGSVEALRQSVVDKHRGYSYALSLSEIPETDDLAQLADYYDALYKYPELSTQLRSGSQKLGELATRLNEVNNVLGQFNPGDIADPASGFTFDFGIP